MILVEYDSNNSGGDWWLKDEDWEKLEKAGWLVQRAGQEFVFNDKSNYLKDKDGFPTFTENDKDATYLNSKYRQHAWKKFETIQEAITEFEEITGANVSDEGCNCCGSPHSFNWSEEGKKDDYNYASGEELLNYMYDNVPNSLRDACK